MMNGDATPNPGDARVQSVANAGAAAGPLLIVLNPGSGAHDVGAACARVEAVVTAAGRRCEFLAVRDPRRLGEVAAACVQRAVAEGGTVVAAGGDGTINAVAHAALGAGCPFGVLPMGTFNYFSRTHHIPEDIEQAAQVLVGGSVRPVQIGAVNERIFLVNASLGMYPQLLEERETAKRQFGRSRVVAFASALYTLLRNHRVVRLWLRCDDAVGSIVTPTLFVGNNRLQLEQIGIAEAACVEDGRLAAIALRPVSPLGMLALALRGSLGRLGEADNVVSFAFGEMLVSVGGGGRKPPRVKVAIDGEVLWMRLPLQFRVAPQPLPLLCPPPATE